MRSQALAALAAVVALAAAHEGHGEAKPGASYMEQHMATEHHIDSFSFFNLHDLNRDGILDRAELEAVYGLHHEESKSNSNDEDHHNSKTDEIIEKVLAKLDTNKDGVVTKREFLIAGNQALPNFEGIEGLGHHYNPEGEYWLHHEELYHNTPETQTDESYTHKEDLEHFAHHDEIEAEEDALVNKAQGLDEDGNPLPQKVSQAPALTSVEKAKKAKADAARAYKMASAEASKQGPWPAGDFRKPKSKSDRLRAGMPYKYRFQRSGL